MRLSVLLSVASLTSASSHLPPTQHIFSNPETDSTYKIPTVHESAIQARRILHLETIGTLSTVFPTTHDAENRPGDVSGTPIGLMDYFGDCEPDTGNPTILAISIATSFKNVAAGSNITLSLRWHPPYAHNTPYSAASMPRFSLVGHLEYLTPEEIASQHVPACFVKYHPDSAAWLPGNRIHESKWARLVVEDVYWIGGFGDRAYIGWIPLDEWKSVTKKEIEQCRLPGEKKSGWGFPWASWLGLDGQQQSQGEFVDL
ncbi:pyridoxamine 5'-phosphate oxidase-domain-containing protein [Clohesyomyces aquaticus]|uniref:Pyridoxamine 5'-phosphate oxidase-domain-containing protein n=1 Tax=Clohesyomyces aquaticus TaxID=1231657 RepID=A0A1Y2A847_9PLEO|nr:pyridoxamine 5'-phosphate oxidase-domain-containing protein [Clohesyomyces aquaticus]